MRVKVNYKDCISVIKKWLYIGEEEGIVIILACALDRLIPGDPCWIFVVAPPSNTKSEILRALRDGDMFYQLSTLTPNSFISGYIKPDKNKVEDLGTQLNGKVLVMKDFTSILSMGKDKRDEIIGQLREAYDGFISRKLGNIDKKITIESSFGFIAAVTPAIDRYYSIMGQLGERFLKVRLDYDEDGILDSTEDNEGKEEQMRTEITEAVMGLLTNVKPYEIKFSKEDIKKIKELAKFIAILRAAVYARWQGDGFVSDMAPAPEKPARVYKQLKKLAKLIAILLGEKEFSEFNYGCLQRIAIDSIPQDRFKVWKFLFVNGTTFEKQIRDSLKIPRTSLQKILEAMWRLKLVDRKAIPFDKDNEKQFESKYWISRKFDIAWRDFVGHPKPTPKSRQTLYVKKGEESNLPADLNTKVDVKELDEETVDD